MCSTVSSPSSTDQTPTDLFGVFVFGFERKASFKKENLASHKTSRS
jgi:hypothetical protein